MKGCLKKTMATTLEKNEKKQQKQVMQRFLEYEYKNKYGRRVVGKLQEKDVPACMRLRKTLSGLYAEGCNGCDIKCHFKEVRWVMAYKEIVNIKDKKFKNKGGN